MARPAAADSLQRVRDADAIRALEDDGHYAQAATALRGLRARVKPDGDLELWLALDEARSGQLDSAWARMNGPLLSAALTDTLPALRWREYDARRAWLWLDGRFTGWHAYVAQARAELALALGRPQEALAAANVLVRAEPLTGRAHLLLAVAAGRAGDAATAREAARRAAYLDPLLPEAEYLRALWAWRDGDRLATRAALEAAIARDSAWSAPAIAFVRSRMPGAKPDSLPTHFLVGRRRVAELVSPVGPKIEENPKVDTSAGLYGTPPQSTVPDSLRAVMHLAHPLKLYVTVLVDENGRAVADYFPYLDPATLPAPLLHDVLASARDWRFRPATRLGRAVPAWVTVEYMINP